MLLLTVAAVSAWLLLGLLAIGTCLRSSQLDTPQQPQFESRQERKASNF